MSFFICESCKDDGVIFANPKCSQTIGFYAFRCICSLGSTDRRKAIPQWSSEFAKAFVPEYIDKRLDDIWVIEETKAGRHTGSAFKTRLEIWGRDRFERAWKDRSEK